MITIHDYLIAASKGLVAQSKTDMKATIELHSKDADMARNAMKTVPGQMHYGSDGPYLYCQLPAKDPQ